MNERIIYECEYCGKKRYMSKYQMRDHEKICWYNPKSKACNTCEHNTYDGTRYCELGIKNEDGTMTSKPEVNCGAWQLKKEWRNEEL